MITNIQLQNFKAFEKVAINPRLITIFIGPNGSGKSTIAQALLLLKYSAYQQDLNPNPPVDLGPLNQLSHRPGNPMTIHFGGTAEMPEVIEVIQDPHPVQFAYSVSLREQNVVKQTGLITLGPKGPRQVVFNLAASSSKQETHQYANKGTTFTLAGTTAIGRLLIVSGYSPASDRALELATALRSLGEVGAKALSRVFYVSADRGFSKPEYQQTQEDTSDFTTLTASPHYESYMATSILLNRDLEKTLSRLVDTVTGISVDSRARPGVKVEIRAHAGKKAINIVNEGFGSNQLVFLFWQVLKAPTDSLIVIEEPENHLHPIAQSKLVDVLIEHTKNENKQLLLCTHSDHIVAKALTSVASKGGLSVDDLAIYYFEKKGDTATARQLEIDSKGRVKGGLPGFFDAQIDEALSHLKALEGNK